MQTWDDTLRASGYRVTPQRQLVLEAVTRLEHATPEEIYAEVKHTAVGVNVSTIYRTLELLEQVGLVTHTHLGHGAHRYHLAADSEHSHLVCRVCGTITELDPATAAVGSLVAALDDEYGFEVDVGHLTVFGLCARCRAPVARSPLARSPLARSPLARSPLTGSLLTEATGVTATPARKSATRQGRRSHGSGHRCAATRRRRCQVGPGGLFHRTGGRTRFEVAGVRHPAWAMRACQVASDGCSRP